MMVFLSLLENHPILNGLVQRGPIIQAGACGYLLKRTSAAGIIGAINEVSNGGAPMTSEIARKLVHAFQTPAGSTSPDVELTQREREVLKLMSEGSTDKKIAADLNLSYHTVKVHARNIYEKLHIHSRAEAVMKYAADKNLPFSLPVSQRQ
jgi:DNA-binding NarL/FixJ family response regulator